MWRENTLAHAHLWSESTQIEYPSWKITQQVWNIKLDGKDKNFLKIICLSSPIVLHYRTKKEEELTFGTPCNWIELIYFVAVNGLLGAGSYGVAMPKHSPYIRNISVAILRLQETSVLDSLHRKWWEYKSHCPKDSNKRGRASGLESSALKH